MKSLLNYVQTTTYQTNLNYQYKAQNKQQRQNNFQKKIQQSYNLQKENQNSSLTNNFEELFEDSSKEISLLQESDEGIQQNSNQLPLLHICLNYKEQSLIIPIYHYSSEISIKQCLIQLNTEQQNIQKIYEICRNEIDQYNRILEKNIDLIKQQNEHLNILQDIMQVDKILIQNVNSQFQLDKIEVKNGQILIEVIDDKRILKFVFSKFRIVQFVQCEKLKNFGRKFQVYLSKCEDYMNVFEKICNEYKLNIKKREELNILIQGELLSQVFM